ncbi:MAG TPA: hypothetical protein VM889_14545 [Candidatus Thermoplasmatota archaeon]|nr:hypothetical protein [Candidatus Thermoplasmatota archaeon]
MIDLAAAPDVPRRLVEAIVAEGRRLGLPLDVLELIAQDRRVATGFLAACRRARGRAFVDALDLDRLRQARDTRSVYAHRLREAEKEWFTIG